MSGMRGLTEEDREIRRQDIELYLQERASLGRSRAQQDIDRLRDADIDEALCWMR